MDLQGVFLLTAILVLFLRLVSYGVEGEMATLSREDDLELDRQLKLLNKPAIKSIQTLHGEIFDCVHINKQPAFDHPLLKNHTIQMRPSSFPEGMIHGASLRARHPQIKLPSGGCPQGTVPIKRTTKEDLMRARMISIETNTSRTLSLPPDQYSVYHEAGVRTTGDHAYYGAKATISVYNPTVAASNQYSQALMSICNDAPNHENCVQVGWAVDPSTYGDNKTRLFVAWTVGGSGCLHTICPGFVQVNPFYPVGGVLEPISTYGGTTYSFTPNVFQDLFTGSWWLAYDEKLVVGYWPKDLFTSLNEKATGIAWVGATHSSNTSEPNSPPMGSGAYPKEGFGRASFMGDIQVVNEDGKFVALNESSVTNSPDQPCYAVGVNHMSPYGLYSFYFGGPGGLEC